LLAGRDIERESASVKKGGESPGFAKSYGEKSTYQEIRGRKDSIKFRESKGREPRPLPHQSKEKMGGEDRRKGMAYCGNRGD